VGCNHLFRRPPQNRLQRLTRGASVGEGNSKFSWHRWFRGSHQVQSGDKCAPALKPSSRELLNEVGENRGPTLAMKEDNFRGDPIAPYDRMFDLPHPCGDRLTAEFCVELDILAFLPQTGRRIDRGVRICLLPVAEECVVEGVGRDEIAHRAQGLDLGAKIFRKRRWRPEHQIAVGLSDDGHARGVMKTRRRHDRWPVRDPDIPAKLLQHCGCPKIYTGV
jgi:hypothetical protein